MLARNQFEVRGCDVSETSLAVARAEANRHGLQIPLKTANIYNLDPALDSADTVLCCEVLEHLVDPAIALKSSSRSPART